jgi:RimJ/RimL family protein N-acetyltransferase
MENYWQTKQIRLRAIEPGDAETFFHWNEDTDRNRFLHFLWPPQSLASVKQFCEDQSKKKFENDSFHWLIETLDGTPVGTIATFNCDHRSGTFSYGVDIAAEHRRKGYAREAILRVIDYYFEQHRYQKVVAFVHGDNEASIRLHEQMGFQLEGRLRRMVFQNGQYYDEFFFGMTAEEYFTLKNRQEEARS